MRTQGLSVPSIRASCLSSTLFCRSDGRSSGGDFWVGAAMAVELRYLWHGERCVRCILTYDIHVSSKLVVARFVGKGASMYSIYLLFFSNITLL